MFEKNRSGQNVYFGLVSALSGNPVAGVGTGVSGRVSLDGGAQALFGGSLTDLGGGQYVQALFATDINANVAGMYWTASGCVPISFTVPTTANVSGKVYPESGLAVGLLSGGVVTVASGSLSGQIVTASSGSFVVATSGLSVIASLYSGQQVIPSSGTLSGQFVTPMSGLTFIASGSIVSGLIASGIVFVASGAYCASGMFTTASLNSGQSVLVYSGQLSGQAVNLLSGNQTQVWSGTSVNVFSGQLSGQVVIAASGVTVTVPSGISTISAIYSGNLSGQLVVAASGVFANIASGTTFLSSGQLVNLLSGNVTSPYSGSLSGQVVVASSGNTVVVVSGLNTISALYSGQTTLPYSGSLSGQIVTAASGAFVVVPSGLATISTLYSGQITLPYSGSMSGQQVQTLTNLDKSGYTANSISGTTYLASGYNTNVSGTPVTVASFLSGAAKSILVEGSIASGTQLVNDSGLQITSIDLPQAVAAILATQAGRTSGAGGTTFDIGNAGSTSPVNRVVATTDASGNRNSVVLRVPN